jgi:hypothetical protein
MKKNILFSIVILLSFSLFAQETSNKPMIKVGGFVNYNMFYDSRENVAAVDGLFLFYPKNELLEDGVDIYDNPSVTMLSLASRLRVTADGVQIMGGQLGGKIEADFTLVSGATTVRFRHAYIKLQWSKTSLLVGQTWHPLFVNNCFPTTLGIATGAPFQPFSRTPQIRFTFEQNHLYFLVALLSEMDYSSTGPFGKSPQYMRYALLPEFAAQVEYRNTDFLVGIVGEVKSLKPRNTTTGTNGTFKTTEKITTFAAKLFTSYKQSKWEAKASAMYGENMYNVLMNGGYGVATYDAYTGKETYTPLSGFYSWLNVFYGRKFKVGLFAGYYKNLGSSKPLYSYDLIWARGADIDALYRMMPTFLYAIHNIRLGMEFEWNQANYGDLQLSDGRVTDSKGIDANRIMFDITYFF